MATPVGLCSVARITLLPAASKMRESDSPVRGHCANAKVQGLLVVRRNKFNHDTRFVFLCVSVCRFFARNLRRVSLTKKTRFNLKLRYVHLATVTLGKERSATSITSCRFRHLARPFARCLGRLEHRQSDVAEARVRTSHNVGNDKTPPLETTAAMSVNDFGFYFS